VKLLLDEMWSPEIAVQLRRRGHDVVAVAERPELRGQPDDIVFAAAQAEGRAVVTENVLDYRPLGAVELEHGRSHAGLIFTTNRRFPRHDARTSGRLVTALNALLVIETAIDSREMWL
jgi:NADPH-dependent 2,4-dienoyl-CoA reductase/sulfur reductase-like enzyme